MRLHVRIILAVAALLLAVVASPTSGDAASRARVGGLGGTVYGYDGSALPGAIVTAYALPGAKQSCEGTQNDWRPVAKTATRADGSYQLSVGSGTYRVGVMPPDPTVDSFGYRTGPVSAGAANVTSWVGYASDISVPTLGLTGVDVRLDMPAAVRGTIAEYGTLAPLGGVDVRLVPDSDTQLARNVAATRTAADGTYMLAGLPVGAADPRPDTPENEALRYGIVVIDPTGWHDLWLWWWTPFNDLGNDTPVVVVGDAGETYERSALLRPTGRIAGKVVNERGRPISGIEVAYASAYPYPPVVTDSRGRFYLPAGPEPANPADAPSTFGFRDPAGRYRTTYYPGVPYAEQGTNLFVAVGTEVAVTMPLRGDAATVTGSTWWSAGVPATRIEVAASDPTHPTWVVGSSLDRPPSQCDGTFKVTGLWPGAYGIDFVFIDATGEANLMERTYLNVAASEVVALGSVMLPSDLISGQVMDEWFGRPVPDITVQLVLPFNYGGGDWVLYDAPFSGARAVTDADGRFRLYRPALYTSDYLVRLEDLAANPRYVGEWFDGVALGTAPNDVVAFAQHLSDWDPTDDQGPFFVASLAPVASINVCVTADGTPISEFAVVDVLTAAGDLVVRDWAWGDSGGCAGIALGTGSYKIRVQYILETEYWADKATLESADVVSLATGDQLSITVDF